jgi:hypothetical protein
MAALAASSGRLPRVKIIVLLAIVGTVLVAWLVLRGYGDGGPDV